ncbi:MAG: choice-of-anchor P family protein, partial [Acidimicrobiales bacterium]
MRGGTLKLRRRLAGLLGVSAVAMGAVVLLVPARGSASAPRPGVFVGTAVAAALHEEENGQAGFAVYEPFYGSFADGLTTYTAAGVSARASTFWPGPTVGNPASFICQLNCISVPAYPLSVETEGNPPTASQETSASVGGPGQPASAQAASADVAASVVTGVSSDAVAGGYQSPGAAAQTSSLQAAPALAANRIIAQRIAAASAWFRQEADLLLHPSTSPAGAGTRTARSQAAPASSAVVAVKSMTASTSQHFDGSTLLVNAETDLSGVSLLGGMIQIGSVQTTSASTGDGGAIHTHTDHVTVSGVTVDGVPATIDQNGVTVDGQGTGSAALQSLNAALQQALAASGSQVTLVGATTHPPQPLGGCGAKVASADQADGIFVHTSTDLQSVPVAGDTYNGDYTLGSACTSLVASDPGGSSASATGPAPAAAATAGTGGPS